MSLEMPGSDQTTKQETLFLNYQEQSSDWEQEFLSVIKDPKEEAVNNQEQVDVVPPIETLEVVSDFQVPINIGELNNEGSVTIALDDVWSQQLVTESSNTLQPVSQDDSLQHVQYVQHVQPVSPNLLQSVPIYLVEGKEDPEDGGICVVSPPPIKTNSSPSSASTPVNRVSVIASTPSITVKNIKQEQEPTSSTSAPASPSKRFFEKNNIMKWVIDDTDHNDIPDLPQLQKSKKRKLDLQPSTSLTSTSVTLKQEKPIEDDVSYQHFPRKRGRPADDSPRKITPKLPRMRKVSTTSDSESYTSYHSDSTTLTDDEVSALKYRRMRDLNNEASKRCREARKKKKESTLAELEALQEKNTKLRMIVQKLETRVNLLKQKFLSQVEQPGQQIAAARRRAMGQQLNIDPDIIGSLMTSSSLSSNIMLPDVNSLWST